MDFKLNIGKLTETIDVYSKILDKLSEEKEAINNALNRLYEEGWSGQAKDKFEEIHKKKQMLYTEVEENIKYLRDILENEEKPKAVELKKRSEDFVNKVSRNGGGSGGGTSDDEGTISLLYSGVDKINNIIDNCTGNHYNRMQRQYDSVNDLLGQLRYTSFGISGDIDECYASVQEQTHNLNDFRDSLGAYNQGVIEMEDNLISKLSFIQESTNMSFKTDYDSGVSADAEVALIYISSLLTKRINELSDDEKAYLEKVETMLGVENYKKLKELIWSFIVAEIQNVHVVDEKKLQDKFDRIKGLLENDIVINDPLKMNTIKQWITNDRRANLSLLRSTIGHTGKRILPIDYADHIKDSINLRKAPGEDKLKYLCDFLYDKFIGQIKNMNTNIADISGMDPKYAELYGDFSSGMLMESFAAISGAGIKSANALKNGEAIYDGDVVAGSGIGNLGGKEKAAYETSYVESIADLRNTENFKDGALEHILEGQINNREKAVGFHYEGFPTSKGKIIDGTKSVPDELGIYTGRVEVSGIAKTANGGKSTFFPESWTAQDVIDAINEAYKNKVFVRGNTYIGTISTGMKIEMFIDGAEHIISAYPKF